MKTIVYSSPNKSKPAVNLNMTKWTRVYRYPAKRHL
jgi:hypothetical protein